MDTNLKLFDDKKEYRIDKISEIVQYDTDYVRKVLKESRITARKISPGRKNAYRFSGEDLNKVFSTEISIYAN